MEHSGSTDKPKNIRKGSLEAMLQCLSGKRPQCTVGEGKWKGIVVQHMQHPGSYNIAVCFPTKFSNIQSETAQPRGKGNKCT